MTVTDRTPAVYEFTVVGVVGPVLRTALVPHVTASFQSCTVLRAQVPTDADLVDLVRELDARGLEISQVTAVG